MPCALTQASLDSATWYFFAEGGGFEPPVRLPVRQFSKLLVSATHPSFLAVNAEDRKLSESLLPHESGCKGTTKNAIMQIFSRKNVFYSRNALLI